MSALGLLGLGVISLLVGAMGSLLAHRNRRKAGWVATLFVAGFSLASWLAVVSALRGGGGATATIARLPLPGSELALGLGPLAAVFLAIVATIALLATLYSVEYMTHYRHDGVIKFYPVLLVFFASVAGVLAARDFVAFLMFWESMTLTSFFLVVFERENPAAQRAGLKYFVITHAATLCLVAAALVLWRQGGSFRFEALRIGLDVLLAQRPLLGHVVIGLLIVGFATKAGILPMGDWLPDAHPVAPSGMSAVLSGALVKLGVYGMLLVALELLPIGRATRGWGIAIALAGTVSMFVGTLTALAQLDTKRLMAFHTIGQIGYVCLGIGTGVALLDLRPALAAVALAGGVFHAVNHACFKACLFLGAGAILFRTGERDMNRLGGAGRAMPVTRTSTTIAALAIAGVPPLNGFASKWLIVASCILAGVSLPVFLLLGLIALFVSLTTLASFLKVVGAIFLGPGPRSRQAEEVPAPMAVTQAALAFLCVLLGLVPFVPLRAIIDALAATAAAALPPAAVLGSSAGLSLAPDGVALAAWAPLVLAVTLAVLAAGAWVLQRSGAARVRTVTPWACGEEHSEEQMRYPAGGFYLPFKHAFKNVYPSWRMRAPAMPAHVRRVLDVDRWLYDPLADGVSAGASRISRSHVGIPQVYLLWIVAGAIVVVGILLAAASAGSAP